MDKSTIDKSIMDKWIDNSIKVLENWEAQARKRAMADYVAELKRSEPDVVCDPALFLARPLYGPPLHSTSSEKKMNITTLTSDANESSKPTVVTAEKPLADYIDKLKRSEPKVFCDPTLFLARPLCGPPLVAASSGYEMKNDGFENGKDHKDNKEQSENSETDRDELFEDELDAFVDHIISISRRAPGGFINQQSVCARPEHDDKNIAPATEFKSSQTHTFSTVTFDKNLKMPVRIMQPVKLYSTSRGPVRPAINNYDRYGYLNTSRKEIKVLPEPIFTTIGDQRRIKNILIRDDKQDSEVREPMDYDELPSNITPIWTQIPELVSECFDIAGDQTNEPPQIAKAPVATCVLPKKYRETIRDYANNLENAQPNVDQEEMVEKMKKKGIEQRIRRKLEEGSYSNYSVNEKKLYGNKDTILRLTWKGKLPKLRKVLNDKRSHAYINRQDYCGRTALHYAASWDCPQTIKLLLAVPGINPDIQDADGKTALRKACEIKSLSCAKLLVEFGASPLLAAIDQRNPFEYVIQEQGDDGLELAKYFYHDAQMYCEKREEGIVSYLHQLCLSEVKVVKLAEELITSGANINATEGAGRTPLIAAIQMNRLELIELFLKFNADSMHIDNENKLAICYANSEEPYYEKLTEAMLQATLKQGKELRERYGGRLQTPQEQHRESEQSHAISSTQRGSPTRGRV